MKGVAEPIASKKMYLPSLLPVLALVRIPCIRGSPLGGTLDSQEHHPHDSCEGLEHVVDALRRGKATALCSSYLQSLLVTLTLYETATVPSTAFATVTSTRTTTTTATIVDLEAGAPSTSYVFLSGNPPAASLLAVPVIPSRRDEHEADGNEPQLLPHQADLLPHLPTSTSSPPSHFPPPDTGASLLSGACSCLSLPTPTKTIISTATTHPTTTTILAVTTTLLTTSTLTVRAPPLITKTVYPCATSHGSSTINRPRSSSGSSSNSDSAAHTIPSPGPAYGLSNYIWSLNASPLSPPAPGLVNGTSNTIFPLGTVQGRDSVGCCNACWFELEYCVQAWWYFYQGCVAVMANGFQGSLANPANPANHAEEERRSGGRPGGGRGGGGGWGIEKRRDFETAGDDDADADAEAKATASASAAARPSGKTSGKVGPVRGGSGWGGVVSRAETGLNPETVQARTCPRGLIEGLTYGADEEVPFRSTGNFAGPCGVHYVEF